jgi:GNAT superfamily N-acetyltransferase
VERERDGYLISDDRARLDVDAIWGFLRTAYWSPNVPREVVASSIPNSLCFGLYAPDGSQAGFARAVTDRATFAWLADVFVLEPHRGRGLGVWLVETVLEHPDLQGVRQVILATADAHDLYRRFGFEDEAPGRLLSLQRRRERDSENQAGVPEPEQEPEQA